MIKQIRLIIRILNTIIVYYTSSIIQQIYETENPRENSLLDNEKKYRCHTVTHNINSSCYA